MGAEFDLRALTIEAGEDAPLPARIGTYRIISLLGAGGMGAVYEAEQDEPRRRVALKVIRAGVVSRTMLRRFRHEAQMLGRLAHPGIAQIYEAGTADDGEGGTPFFAMELVSGEPLLQYARAPRPWPCASGSSWSRASATPCSTRISGASFTATSSPPTSWWTRHGQPKMLDFGVARATDADVQADDAADRPRASSSARSPT